MAEMDSLPPTGVGSPPPPTPEAQAAPLAPSAPGHPTLTLVPSPAPTPELTPEQRTSQLMLMDVLGMNSDRPTAAVIPMPTAEDKALVEAKTVEEALPLIGNMMKAEKQGGGIKRPYPRVALKHQHIVAFMLCNPFATTTEICNFFSISPTTLGNITKSDTFQSLVASHRVTLESGIGADLQSQLRDTMAAAIEVVQKAVVQNQDPEFALQVMDKAANRMGLGAKHNSGPMVQVNVVTPEMIAAARASRRLSS